MFVKQTSNVRQYARLLWTLAMSSNSKVISRWVWCVCVYVCVFWGTNIGGPLRSCPPFRVNKAPKSPICCEIAWIICCAMAWIMHLPNMFYSCKIKQISVLLSHTHYTRHQSHLFAVKWHGLCIWHKSLLFLLSKMDFCYVAPYTVHKVPKLKFLDLNKKSHNM